MIPAPFDYLAPRSLDEAIKALAAQGEDAKLLAGGHSLLPILKLRLATPKTLIDLRKIPDLRGIREEGGKISIGALTTHYEIESSELLKRKCPLLPKTAQRIGDVQVRNRGTIGGSLAHADPAADWPAAILALGAELKLRGPKGERWLSAEDFFLDIMTTALEPAEILTEIRVPVLTRQSGAAYLKMAQKASGFAIIGIAVWLELSKSRSVNAIGVGITGLSNKPFKAVKVETGLRGKRLSRQVIEEAVGPVADGISALDDIHASKEFRAHLARIYTAKAIAEAATGRASI
ncbi:MAG TPA: xanthine dehydrogenase family protein subunit M [Candidatus Binatia bacterium]|nr:xanthine dehydrogenase family protein subunit M [Candidatus Binatia bacterium]